MFPTHSRMRIKLLTLATWFLSSSTVFWSIVLEKAAGHMFEITSYLSKHWRPHTWAGPSLIPPQTFRNVVNAVFVQQTMKIVSWPHICTQLEIRQMCGASFRLTRMWLLRNEWWDRNASCICLYCSFGGATKKYAEFWAGIVLAGIGPITFEGQCLLAAKMCMCQAVREPLRQPAMNNWLSSKRNGS